MKKIICTLLLVMCLTTIFMFASNLSVSAESLSDTCKTVGDDDTSYVYGNMTVHQQRFETKKGNDPEALTWNYHTLSWVDFSLDEYKIVTYSGNNADKWKQLTTRQAAEEYEATHPGWIVVAGTNGDFFKNSADTDGKVPATYEPTNNYMSDGDMLRPDKTGVWYRQSLGFTSDGEIIEGDPTISSSMYIRKYDSSSGEYTNVATIAAVNKEPVSTGATLLTYRTYQMKSYDLTGCNVYVGKYTLNRIANTGGVFVKGTIQEKKTLGADYEPAQGEFLLVDKDGSLASAIAIGDTIKCEYVYEGDWATVENSMGYVYKILDNSEIIVDDSMGDFIYTTHPRTLMGMKEDGSIIMMVAEGRGKQTDYEEGLALTQAAEVLKNLGCVKAFNFDGGGSSTLVVKNQYGGFDVVNDPSDGGERSDGNHMLIVKRDPGFNLDSSESTFNTLNFSIDVTNETLYANVKNLKVTVNDQTITDVNKLSFTSLKPLTEYKVTISYDNIGLYDTNETENVTIVRYFTTPDFTYPDAGFKVTSVSKTSVTIERNMNLECSSWIKNIVISLGSQDFNMGTASKFVCEDLLDDQEYDLTIKFDYVLSATETFKGETESQKVKTLSYELPVIEKFEEYKKEDGTLQIEYKYTDDDSAVTESYILCNGEKTALTRTSGKAKFEDLDFTNTDYTFKLVLEYADGKIESEELKYTHTGSTDPDPGTGDGGDITPTPSDNNTKKKCGKKSVVFVLSLIGLTSSLAIILRKKH